MVSFSDLTIPFEWLPTLQPDEWIVRLDIWIARYPEDYSVYSNGRHKPGVHIYWVEDGKRLAPDIYLNYYTQRIYPPIGAKPVGIYSDSPVHAGLRGEALIATPDTDDDVLLMLKRIEAKIDAL